MRLIIGGTSGIGAEFARIEKLNNRNWVVPDKTFLDVTNFEQMNDFFEANTRISHVVYSAGVNYLSFIGKSNLSLMGEVLAVNLGGFITMMELLGRYNKTAVRIVAVGSDAAERPLRTSMTYCASKAGLHMAVRTAARELGSEGWKINAVAPGMTDRTGMQEYVDATVPKLRGWTPEHTAAYEKSQEVVPGRLQPLEVARVIKDTLYGPDHLNGSIITINGGR
jgi:NAD(P)-dependent dehydrogenase (short-subunit alcohol dehydrogenase family)